MKCRGIGSIVARRALGTLAVMGVMFVSSGCAGTPDQSLQQPASARSNQDVFALSAAAERAYQNSRWIDAVRHYETLTAELPRDAYTWFRLGNAYARQGDYSRAIPAYETSIGLDAHQPKPWFNLSSAYLLNARGAMLNAYESLRVGDPARRMIQQRISALDGLLHQRFEDQTGPASAVAFR